MLSKIRSSLVLKINIAIVLIIFVSIAVTAWTGIAAERQDLIDQMADKGANIATAMEKTAQDSVEENNFYSIKAVISDLMKDNEFTYITLVNNDGKAIVHSDPLREGRVFNDPVGLKAAKTHESLVQLYSRDDGQQYWDFSDPIEIKGQHWGALRIGIPTAVVTATMEDTVVKSITIGLIIVLLSALIITIMLRTNLKPLGELMKVTEVVALGDFTQQIQVKTSDEIGRLSTAFNSMILSIRTLIGEIVSSSKAITLASEQLSVNTDETVRSVQQVASAVEDIARGNNSQTDNLGAISNSMNQINITTEQIASGAQEQSSGVGFTSETVLEMSHTIEQVSSEAQAVKTGIIETSEIAESGGTDVKQTIEGMSRIRSTVLESAEKIKDLGSKSQQIGDIIKVIDDIAEQTNLLALNAAIESARAGEHGKGFAVVADEVRKLAERSSKATKEIADLINDVQAGTEIAITAMKAGTEEVEKGVKLAGDADIALRNILGAISRSVRQIENIAASSDNMRKNSIVVVDAIKNVADITEQNAAATEEMAASINETSGAIQSVAAMSEQISASTEEITASVEEITATTEEISASADKLAETAKGLDQLISSFRV